MGPKTLDLEKKLLGQWNALVRRARIGRDCKVAALTVSSYADPDGTGIRLSVARFAVDLEVSYSTARRYLAWLRKVGLLEMTRAGSRRNQTASEYRLILHPDVMENLDVPSPARIKELADEMREAERDGTRTRTERMRKADQRSSEASVESDAEEAASEEINAHQEEALIEPINAQMARDQRSPQMTYTPSRTHLSEEVRPSRADEEDLCTDVTGPRATRTPTPNRCPSHHIPLKPRSDGGQACPMCRRGVPPAAPELATVTRIDSRRPA
jgi:hypothetical protein